MGGETAMLRRLRLPRGGPEVEVGVAIPIGCLVPLGMAIAVLVGIGVVVGTSIGRSNVSNGPDHVVVRVIDDGAQGGPAVLSTAVVSLNR